VIQKHFSLASGFGIQGMFVFQDFSQLFDLYGRNESITSNCDVKVAFAPNNLETAEYLSRLLGAETREKGGRETLFLDRKSQKPKQSVGRPLLTPDECSRLPRSKSIIVRNGFSPILGDKVPYYEIPALLERSRISPPASDRIMPSAPRWWEAIAEKPRRIRRTTDAGATEPKSSNKASR
ncbi:MAG: type IV secretory system conjugative DNA transfer family protein, partial [Bdellovibrionales bacterium]|nr:type IV secretory system conjugative DNA transfer family protein [Bdellovibrionales bacterium]